MTTLFSSTTVGQDLELKRILARCGWTSKDIQKIIRHPEIAGDMLVAVRSFVATPSRPRKNSRLVQFAQHLNPLAEQKAVLLKFNAQAGDLAVPNEWLEYLSTSSRHSQSLEDLETFVIWCGTLEKTVRYAQALMEFCQGKIWDTGFKTGEQSMRLHEQAYPYTEAGVYRVRVNVIDNWTPGKQHTINDVYGLAAANPDYLLTSVEGIFAYALQKLQLIRMQDRVKLPYLDCSGIQLGKGFAYVLSIGWLGARGGVGFGTWGVDDLDACFSAPSLLGAPRRVV